MFLGYFVGSKTPLERNMSSTFATLLPGLLRIRVLRAKGLYNREVEGNDGLSDPYVRIYDQHRTLIFRSSVIDSNLNPEWPDDATSRTQLLILLPEGKITFQVWDENRETEDVLLGEHSIPVSDFICFTGVRAMQLRPTLHGVDEELKAIGERLGTLFVDFNYVHQPLAAPEHLDPNLFVQTKMPQLPVSLTLSLHSVAGLPKGGNVQAVVMSPSGASVLAVTSEGGNFPVQNATVTIEIRRKDLAGTIGVKLMQGERVVGELRIPALMAIRMGHHNKGITAPFYVRAQARETDPAIVAASEKDDGGMGVVKATLAVETLDREHEVEEPPGGMTIRIDSAEGLLNREKHGVSDPFVKILDQAKKVVYESEAVSSTLQPVWPQGMAPAYIRIYSRSQQLTFQVWDKNPLGDAFMGQARVTAEHLLHRSKFHRTSLRLVPRENEMEKALLERDLGFLHINFDFEPDAVDPNVTPKPLLELHAKPPGTLGIECVSAEGLLNRESGGRVSDPFVKLINTSGKCTFESKAVDCSVNPVWHDQHGTIRLATGEGLIRIEVWDKNPISDEFLGAVTMAAEDALLYATTGRESVFRLRPRPQEADDVILQKGDNLGYIHLNMHFDYDQTRPPQDVSIPQDITGTLQVTIVGARKLYNFELGGISDPFCKVIGKTGQEILRTPVCDDSLDPNWTKNNVATVGVHNSSGILKVQLWDSNAIIDQFMGEATVSFADLIAFASLPLADYARLALRPRVMEADKKVSEAAAELGVLLISVTFDPSKVIADPEEEEAERLFEMDVPISYVLEHLEKDEEAKTLLRDLMMYIPFIVLFALFSFWRRDSESEFYINRGFEQQFTMKETPPTLFHQGTEDFSGSHHFTAYWEIMTTNEWHNWVEGVVLPNLFDHRRPNAPNGKYGPFGHNLGIGALRLRTLRVRNNTCTVNPAFYPRDSTAFPRTCYDEWDLGNEDTGEIPAGVPFTNRCSYFLVEIEGDLKTYQCGGHVIDFPLSQSFNATLTKFRELREKKFFDPVSVRFIVLEMFSYNRPLNVFTSAKFFQEITQTGGWIPTVQVRSFRVYTGNASLWLGLDLVFTFYVFYYTIKFFVDWRRSYRKYNRLVWYWTNGWTLLEIVNLGVFWVVFALHYEWYLASDRYTSTLSTRNPDEHPEQLNYIMNMYFMELYLNACNCILTFLKILKFLRLNAKLSILTRTMSRATENILGLLAIFFLIMTAFALAGNQMYGSNLFEWRDISSTFSTLFRALMGSFDYEELREKQRALTFIFFWGFIILGLFVMLNFITAIIGTAYEEEQDAEKSLPMAVQIRRAIRALRSFDLREFSKSLWNFLVRRTRRLRTSVLLEYVAQHRLSLLANDGLDDFEIRMGRQVEPEYLINREKFQALIPSLDKNFLPEEWVDHMYLEIAEDYELLHCDEEKEMEHNIESVFMKAVADGFQAVVVDKGVEIRQRQQMLLQGKLDTATLLGLNPEEPQGRTGLEQSQDDCVFDPIEAANQILLQEETGRHAADVTTDITQTDDYERRHSVLSTYLEVTCGRGEPRHGLRGVYESAVELEYAVKQLSRLVKARAHTLTKEFKR